MSMFNALATLRNSPTGESQMPITRSPSTRLIASVTMPAGLVKLMTHADGARSCTASAIRNATGIVRSP